MKSFFFIGTPNAVIQAEDQDKAIQHYNSLHNQEADSWMELYPDEVVTFDRAVTVTANCKSFFGGARIKTLDMI